VAKFPGFKSFDFPAKLVYTHEPIPLNEARQAVQIARRVRKQIRWWLPKASLTS